MAEGLQLFWQVPWSTEPFGCAEQTPAMHMNFGGGGGGGPLMKPDVNCLFSTLFGEPFLSSQQLSPTLQTWTGVGDDAVNANDVQPFHSQQACAHAVAFFNVLDWWRACPTNCRPGVIFAIDVFGKHCVGPPPSCRPVP